MNLAFSAKLGAPIDSILSNCFVFPSDKNCSLSRTNEINGEKYGIKTSLTYSSIRSRSKPLTASHSGESSLVYALKEN